MTHINIDINAVTVSNEQLRSIAKGVQKVSYVTGSVAEMLNSYSSNQYFGVYGVLDRMSDNILNEAVKLDSLADALYYIAQTYTGTEKRISNVSVGLKSPFRVGLI